jgi:hypothetical protein
VSIDCRGQSSVSWRSNMSQISQNTRGATVLGFIPFLKLEYGSVTNIYVMMEIN